MNTVNKTIIPSYYILEKETEFVTFKMHNFVTILKRMVKLTKDIISWKFHGALPILTRNFATAYLKLNLKLK